MLVPAARSRSNRSTLAGSPALGGWLLVMALSLVGCDGSASPTAPSPDAPTACGVFEPWMDSAYVLPYPVGTAWVVGQANCSVTGGHRGFWQFGYDFPLAIGSVVTAARGGIVRHSVGSGFDGDVRITNLVTIQHDDGTVAVYSHLTHDGALVAVGERVRAGDSVGLSGNSGGTGGNPHLHFSVHPCAQLPGLPDGDLDQCPTLPINFRNTDPNPQGLVAGRAYLAQPYDG